MALELSLKSSAIPDKLPQPGQLQLGEIGLNFSEEGPFLSCCDSAGNIKRLNSFWVSKTPPTTPSAGLPWVDTNNAIPALKIYVDGNWINAVPPVVGAASELAKDVWIDIKEEISNSVAETTEQIKSIQSTSEGQGQLLAVHTAALNELAAKRVKGEDIERGAISAEHLSRGSITEDALSPSVVTATAIADNAITEAAISSGAITSLKLAQGAINESAIAEGAITVEKLNKDAVISSQNVWVATDSAIPTSAAIDQRLEVEAKKVKAKLDSIQLSSPEIGDGTIKAAKLEPASLNLGNFKQNNVATSVENWVSSADVLPTTLAVDQRLAAANDKNIDTGNLADGAVTESKLAKGSITQENIQSGAVAFRAFDPAILTTTSGGSISDRTIPTSAYLDKKVADLQDQIAKSGNSYLQPGSVNASHIAAGAVHLGNLAENLITKSEEPFSNTDAAIPSNATLTNQIAKVLESHQTKSNNLAIASVTEVHISNDAVTSSKIAPSSVNISHLEPALRAQLNTIPISKALLKAGNPTVNTDDIYDQAVTAAKIANNTITSAQVKDGSLALTDLDPAAILTSTEVWTPNDQTIPTSNAVDVKISTTLSKFQVSTANIYDFSITTTKLASVAVTNDKIANVAVSTSKIAGGAITLAKVDPNLILTSGLPWSTSDSQLPTTSAVQSAINQSITGLQIKTNNLAPKCVTGDKIADGSVTKNAIFNTSITFEKLDPSWILPSSTNWTSSNSLIPTTASVQSQLDTYYNQKIIDNSQLGSRQVDARCIADATITGTQVADLTIKTQHLEDKSITGEKLVPATRTTLGGVKAGLNLQVTSDGTLNAISNGAGGPVNVVSNIASVVAGKPILIDANFDDETYTGGIFTLYQTAPPPPPPVVPGTELYYQIVPNGGQTPPPFVTDSPHIDKKFTPCPSGSGAYCNSGSTVSTTNVSTDMVWVATPAEFGANLDWQYDGSFSASNITPATPTTQIVISDTNYFVKGFNGFGKSVKIYANYP